jgi:uncharacterized membrane protein YphA (DoxX/SURF4 family)
MLTLNELSTWWTSFFFTPEIPYSLGIFRIIWGVLLTLNALLLLGRAKWYFGPSGLLSASSYRQRFASIRFSLFNYLPDSDLSAYLVIGTHIICAIALTIGWQTRIAIVCTFLTLVSLYNRNPSLFHSGDSLMKLLTFLLIFSHAGDIYSIDQLVA